MARKIAAGNWKMNGLQASLSEAAEIAKVDCAEAGVILCPPATLLAPMSTLLRNTHVDTGAQNCHAQASGAHTGEISAGMVADTGAKYVILGHSERRSDNGETSEIISKKVKAAWEAGLTAIICLGETEDERDKGMTLDVVSAQLAGSVPDGENDGNTIIAYEPVWAIGTGRTATPDEIGEVHAALRDGLADRIGAHAAMDIPLLYGGSVKAKNAKEIFAVSDVDGALVGGASLTAADFGPIITALAAS